MERPVRTDIISNSDWLVMLVRLGLLETHKATLPPLTLKALHIRDATPASVTEQLDQEIKLNPSLEASLHPAIKRFLERYRREKSERLQSTSASSDTKPPAPRKPTRRSFRSNVSVQIDREPFFQIGRALQRGIGKGKLGTVDFIVRDGTLTIESFWGGGRIPCTGDGEITATISATAFCSLVTTRYREKQPAGTMKIIFRPSLKEIGIDLIGVKAQFPA